MLDRNLRTRSGSSASLQNPAALGVGDVRDAVAGERDKWYEQLLKYIPAESLSLYIAIEGVVKGAAKDTMLTVLLAVCLGVSMLFNVLFLRFVWKVTRVMQITISTVALLIYIYSIGGFFEAIGIYVPVIGTLLLVVTTAFLSLAPSPPTPPPSA